MSVNRKATPILFYLFLILSTFSLSATRGDDFFHAQNKENDLLHLPHTYIPAQESPSRSRRLSKRVSLTYHCDDIPMGHLPLAIDPSRYGNLFEYCSSNNPGPSCRCSTRVLPHGVMVAYRSCEALLPRIRNPYMIHAFDVPFTMNCIDRCHCSWLAPSTPPLPPPARPPVDSMSDWEEDEDESEGEEEGDVAVNAQTEAEAEVEILQHVQDMFSQLDI
ncbi:hypothetical protein MMC13_006956 [Lambiella insularis]|nr:hypothetical protein [Lambiella insularis]